MDDRIILHCDINNFYASVEILKNPALAGKPVAVCGDPQKRHGIILAKSMPAKTAGVKTGEAIWEALKKCPDLILVPPDYKSYSEFSALVYNIYTEFTPNVESFGLDECWLDVTGCQKLFGSGLEIAERIRSTVKERTGGLTISIGVSFTKVLAKLGSDLKKPDAITVIDRGNYKKVAWSLPVSEMLYVGRATAGKLNKFNINTIGDLALADRDFLIRQFGKVGEKLSDYARGTDKEEVKCYTERRIPESVGNGTTTPEDITNIGDATSVIYALSEMIGFRLRQYDMLAGGVSLYFRDKTFNGYGKQTKLFSPTDTAFDISEAAVSILKSSYDFATQPPLRMVTVGTYNLTSRGDYIQTSIFEDNYQKKFGLENSIDKLRQKYGYSILKRGVTLGTIFNCDSHEADDDFLPFNKETPSPSLFRKSLKPFKHTKQK